MHIVQLYRTSKRYGCPCTFSTISVQCVDSKGGEKDPDCIERIKKSFYYCFIQVLMFLTNFKDWGSGSDRITVWRSGLVHRRTYELCIEWIFLKIIPRFQKQKPEKLLI